MSDNSELYAKMQDPEDEDWVIRNTGKYDKEDSLKGKEEDVEFERYFLIDYENVNREGLNGITKLLETDCVKIYYSNAAETLTFGLHRRINESKAHFDYIKVQIPIKNAVDCQIVFDIQDLTKKYGNAEYIIVSRDTDFDKAIKYFTSRNLKVEKVLEICKLEDNALKDNGAKDNESKDKEKGEARARSFFGRHFRKKEYVEKKEEIIRILSSSKSRQQVNNELMKLYSSETVSKMIKTLQPLIKDLPGR